MPHTNPPSTWTRRLIVGTRLGEDVPPPWLFDSYRIFRERLTDEAYPCYFGRQVERQHGLYYSYVEDESREHLPSTLCTFIAEAQRNQHRRNNLAVFFKPRPQALDHLEHRAILWATLQFLHDADRAGPPPETADVPSDPRWEFSFGGTAFFVVGLSPSYARHRSRNMGPGLILLFQPREVFVDPRTGASIDERNRQTVRERLRRWDQIEPHPDLGTYGDPSNLEWRQYFLSDDSTPERGTCPLNVRGDRRRRPV